MTFTGSSAAPPGRCRCGRAAEPDHRFCPDCGAAIGAPSWPTGTDRPADAHGSPLLLDPLDGSATVAESQVRTGRGGRPLGLIGLALAVGVAALAWGLFRQDPGETASDAVAPASAGSDESGATGSTGEDDADADDDADDADGDATDPTTTGPTPTTGGEPIVVADAGPLLGEPTGLTLAIGRADRLGVELLDLDSGERREIGRVRGRPVGLIDSTLVVQTDSGSPRLLDLDDPEATAEIISPRDNPGWTDVVSVEDDRVWLVEDGSAGVAYRAYGADGELVDEFDPGDIGVTNYLPFGVTQPSTGLVYHPGGGLYRRDGDGFERVVEGQVMAVGERVAIIQRCDDRLQCTVLWYDVGTAGVIGFPAPPPSAVGGDGLYQIVGGDRWLIYLEWRSGAGRLIEVATGRVARELDPNSGYLGPFRSSWAISEDGRWLLDHVDDRTVVVDLDDGTVWDLGLSDRWDGAFLDTAAMS